MLSSLYVAAAETHCGKSALILGLMNALTSAVERVGFFRPIISDPGEAGVDHDIKLVIDRFGLDIAPEEAFAFTVSQAREMLNSGRMDDLRQAVLERYRTLEERFDFLLMEGLDVAEGEEVFEFDLNEDICSDLGAPILLVASGFERGVRDIVSSARTTLERFSEAGLEVVAVVVNRGDPYLRAEVTQALAGDGKRLLAYLIEEEKTLCRPTMREIGRGLGAKVIWGEERLDNLAENYLVAAMQAGNFLAYLQPGSLIITPGDRADIILASLASVLSSSYPDIAGILLTGGLTPGDNLTRLINGWRGIPVPVLTCQEHTFATSQRVSQMTGRIDAEDELRVATALGVFEAGVDAEQLLGRLVTSRARVVTPKMFEYDLLRRARERRMHIVLPEGVGARVLTAAEILLKREVVELTLVGDEDEVAGKISQMGLKLPGVHIVQPDKSGHLDEFVAVYLEARRHKIVREEDARDRMTDPTYFGTMMVHRGLADGLVSGSRTTTAQTIRPAFEFVKTKPGASIVSSVFFMCLKDRVLVFGDCAVNPNPDAEQLAEIALASAETAAAFGIEPKVAMLSYSTGSSGQGRDVDKVAEATRLARKAAPDLLLEGPMQYDAAIDPGVAKTKMPESLVAGEATVFIFPDLNTGNNTYKAVQRAAGAVAIGPVLQGLNKPVNDLSRGCTVADIVNTVAITAIQAANAGGGA